MPFIRTFDADSLFVPITAPLVELSLLRDHRNSGCSATVAFPLEPEALEVQVVPLLSDLCVGVAAATAVRSDVECTRELAGRSLQGQRRQKRHEAANDKTAGKNDHGYQQPLALAYLCGTAAVIVARTSCTT